MKDITGAIVSDGDLIRFFDGKKSVLGIVFIVDGVLSCENDMFKDIEKCGKVVGSIH